MDELVAVIDTVPLTLKCAEITAAQAQLAQTIAAKRAELASQDNDRKGAEREYRRISELVDKGSLPSQQKDNLETQSDGVNLRLKAGGFALGSLLAQEKAIQAQLSQLRDQIRRCYVKAPVAGVILTRYKNLGEVCLPGNPIYEIGKYDTMRIDFYVAQPMLPELQLGRVVRIRLDAFSAEGKQKALFVPASICWISSDAEFSPKNIQTRESRNELVFKIRALAPNKDGLLKRGLPVEVWK
jgi:HlyD family secretion protein